ncbi:MAG: hypothetical protein P8H92_12610, partial [Paracoccaceae bacterium]|nr:hypothetical protein [Paracoccaceae bacterium]
MTDIAYTFVPKCQRSYSESRNGTWPEICTMLGESKECRVKEKREGIIGGPLLDKRKNERKDNVQTRTMLSLDFDEYVAPLDKIEARLQKVKYAHAAYSTWSHKSDEPRIRLFIPLDRPIDKGEFERLTVYVAKKLDIG